jgi:GDPmannose 4,6-dehydratase
MWLMLQQDEPDDYVIASGETHSVKEFAELAFSHVGLDYQDYLNIDERFYRTAEVHLLKGDYSKGKKILGWEPTVSFKELIQMMVDADIKELRYQVDGSSSFCK